MLFIVSSNVDKPDPHTRKLIRSHAKSHAKRGKKLKERSDGPQPEKHTSTSLIRPEDIAEIYTPDIPACVGSDISLAGFVADLEHSVLLNIAKVSEVALQVMFPLIATMGFHAHNKEWLHLAGADTAALHITAFAVESFIDMILRRQRCNMKALRHYGRGVALLQERLSGENHRRVADSTIGTVLKLACAAHLSGDFETSKHHMEGLRRIVDLRGGLEAFKGTQLHVDMLRCDLGIALLNGAGHVFYLQPSEPFVDFPEKLLPTPTHSILLSIQSGLKDVDLELATIWHVMKKFCLFVNLATQTQRLVQPELVYDTMTAVVYRLLRMEFTSGSVDDVVRHGILALSYHVFLQWQEVRPPYHHFSDSFKRCLHSLKDMHEVSPSFALWLLMVGAISIFDIADEPWLVAYLQDILGECKIGKWREMRTALGSFLWIGSLDDKLGQQVYDTVRSHSDR